MEHITKDEILLAQDLPFEDVPVPEWGAGKVVRVQSITGVDRDSYELSLFEGQGPDRKANMANIRGRLLVRCLTDAEGRRLFRDDEAEALGRKSSAVLDRLFAVARRLNALTDRDVEELAKNSGADRSGATTSDSPNASA